MPYLLPDNRFPGYKSKLYVFMLELTFLCGLLTRQAFYMFFPSESNPRHLLKSAIKAGHISERVFIEWVRQKTKAQRKYYMITKEGLNFLRNHGCNPWDNYISTSARTTVRTETYALDQARQKAAAGDAYALAFRIQLAWSNYLFSGYPGNTRHLRPGLNNIAPQPWQCASDDIDIDLLFPNLDDGTANSQNQKSPKANPWVKDHTPKDIRKSMYAEWTFFEPQSNDLPQADTYYFSANELHEMFLYWKGRLVGKGAPQIDQKEPQDTVSGKYVGIINGKHQSFLLYHSTPTGFGWAKDAGVRDRKAAQVANIHLLPYKTVPLKDASGAVMINNCTSLVNVVTDKYGKRQGKKSAPDYIGVGLVGLYAILMTYDGCTIFRDWVLGKTPAERYAIIEATVKKDYGLSNVYVGDQNYEIPMPPKQRSGKRAERDSGIFKVYGRIRPLYQRGQTPVYDFSCMDLQQLELVRKFLPEKYKGESCPTIGIIAFGAQMKYLNAVFKGVAKCEYFTIKSIAMPQP